MAAASVIPLPLAPIYPMKQYPTLLFLFCALWATAQLPTEGLICHYPCNNSGVDAGPNHLDAQIPRGVSTTEDRFGTNCGALRFNGENGFLQIADNPAFKAATSGFTVSMWVKPEKPANSTNLVLPLFYKGSGTACQYKVVISRNFGDSYSHIEVSNDFTGEDKSYNSHPIEFGTWYHLVLVYDDGFLRAYLNGSLIWQQMKTGGFTAAEGGLDLGRSLSGGVYKYFTGCLDDVRFYNRSLYPADITALYREVAKPIDENFTLKVPDNMVAVADAKNCNATVYFIAPRVTVSCGTYELRQLEGLPSGSEFPMGESQLSFQATAGNKTLNGSFTIKVVDKSPPQLNCPSDRIVKIPKGQETVKLDYPVVTAIDNCTNSKVALVEGPASGSEVGPGVTRVTYSATDVAGNKSTCGFNITVVEDVAPEMHCTDDIVVFCEAEKTSRPINYDEPYVLLRTGKQAMTRTSGPASGAVFPLGDTKVVYELQDATYGKLTCCFTISLRDNSVPVITCPADMKVTCEQGEKTAMVNYTIPTAMDAGEAIPVIRESGPASGDKFPVGVTIVKYSAKDAAGNKTYCSFAVTVEKADGSITARPIKITCPTDIVKGNDKGTRGAIVKYTAPQYSGGSELKLIQTKGLESGAFFPIGPTLNTYKVFDNSGNSRECSFMVNVHDYDPPKLSCPHDTTVVLSPDRRGVQFFYTAPTATDNNNIDTVIQMEGSKSGCFLPIGVHTFSFKAKDKTGNMETCAFIVTVKSADAPDIKVEAPKKLDEALNLGTDSVRYEYKAEVKDCYLTIFIYDDGEEDNDSVSIVFNGQVLVNHEMIRLKENGAIRKNIILGVNNQNYLIAKAWNTGRYGLNTLRIDAYEGNIEDQKDIRNKKPAFSKVLHSRPGDAGGMILKCNW